MAFIMRLNYRCTVINIEHMTDMQRLLLFKQKDQKRGDIIFSPSPSGFLSCLCFLIYPLFFSCLTPHRWSLFHCPLTRWFTPHLPSSQTQCFSPTLTPPPLNVSPIHTHTHIQSLCPLPLCPLSLTSLLFHPGLFSLFSFSPPLSLSFFSNSSLPYHVTLFLPPSHPLSCGSWALCGDATPKTSVLLPLLFPQR